MAGVNTEKPMGKTGQKKISSVKQTKVKDENFPKTNTKKIEEKINVEEKEINKPEEKLMEQKEELKQKKVEKKIIKEEVSVYGKGLPVSTKTAIGICKFIKYKTIKKAISDLEEVAKLKKAVPLKGEISHRKGKIMSGKYPKKAAENFLILIKSLRANAINADMENPIISQAIPNMASRPLAKGGRARKKATHIKLIAKEKKTIKGDKK